MTLRTYRFAESSLQLQIYFGQVQGSLWAVHTVKCQVHTVCTFMNYCRLFVLAEGEATWVAVLRDVC